MRARVFSLLVAMFAAAALVSASSAATTNAQKVATIDVSTRAAVVHYLRSIHVNPKGAVIQRGLRNYAGPGCPGKHWTCAGTKHTIVQIAKRGGQNRFACRTAKCVVVQFGGGSHRLHAAGRALASSAPTPVNTASCIKTTGVTQSCTINQPNATGTNKAVVWMDTGKLTGLTQSANYTASITQGPASGTSSNWNLACVHQFVSIDGSATKTNTAGVTVTNDAHESISIQQNSLTGNNTVEGAAPSGKSFDCDTSSTSQVTQDQQLTSTVTTKGSVTQNQNATSNGANVLLDVEQNNNTPSASGSNTANFEQTSNLQAIANTSGGPVSQTQSSPETPPLFSGIVGTLNQVSTGLSTANVTQTETQCEDAVNASTTPTTCDTNDADPPTGITLTQTQYGPEGVFSAPTHGRGRVSYVHKGYGQSTQTSNPLDQFNITQTSTQNTDQGSGSSQANIVQGDCTSTGSCAAGQTTTVNGGTTRDGYTSGSISLNINCPKNKSCIPTPPPVPTFVSGPSDPNPSSSAAFNFTDPATKGVHFLCSINGGTAQTCQSEVPFFQGYGNFTFQVQASDAFGNVSAFTPTPAFGWTNVPPDPTITASSEPTNPDFFGNSDTFKFSDADPTVHFQCTLDNITTACNSGSITYTPADLSPGSHTFSVRAYDTTDTFGSVNSASYTWTILPLSISAFGSDGSSAGWACQPGGPIGLTLGTDPGTFAQIVLTAVGGTAIDGLPEPTFTTDNYAAGSPRYNIDLSNGDSLIGYPAISGLNGTDMAWAINNGNNYTTWSAVKSAESGTTVIDAYVVADGDQAAGVTDKISDLTFNGSDFNSGTCP